MEKKSKLPKVVMAASVAVMGMGLFSTLENEARATGGSCDLCKVTNSGGAVLFSCETYTEDDCSAKKLGYTLTCANAVSCSE